MSSQQKAQIPVGATWPVLSGEAVLTEGGTFTMADGESLSTEDIAEIVLRAKLPDAETYLIDNAEITDFEVEASGIRWRYPWAEADTNAVRTLHAQLKITLTDGRPGFAPSDPHEWMVIEVVAVV